ncbi:MAG: autotransporter assembly complex family protein [Pseudomonadota bacterium]
MRPPTPHAGRAQRAPRLAALGALMGLLAAFALPAPAWSEPRETPAESEPQSPEETPAAPSGIPYEVRIEGVTRDQNLYNILLLTSQLETLRSKPPASLGGLRRRADEDRGRLESALRSEGYYAGTINIETDEEATPVQVTIEIDPGPRFRLGSYTIDYVDGKTPELTDPPSLEDLDLRIGMTARAPVIVNAQAKVISALRDQGYPHAKVEDRKTVVNYDTRAMTVTLLVDPGTRANFGPAVFEGLEDVEEDYLKRLVTWKEGQLFDQRKLDETRRELADTRLFSSVSLQPAETVEANGELPVVVRVTEGTKRTIGFGLGWSTDIGFGGDAFWTHRNFFGRNEQIRLNLNASEIEQSGSADFRKPAFWRPDQALLASIKFGNEDTDAFDSLGVESFLGLEREFPPHWIGTVGVSLEFEEIDDNENKDQFLIFGTPVTGKRDTTNSKLDPTEGTRLDFAVIPYYVTIDDNFPFLRNELGGTAYYAIDEERRYILAGRARLGSILGPATDDLPADKRFYAGGGGSIRGYAFQSVGPLDEDDDPLGGRSLLELSAEVRFKVWGDFGMVAFVDGGTVYDDMFPVFDETIRWASGLGVRYFTGIGPLRLDVAFPINRRSVDDAFQFYISFGQAF